nr:pseudouridine synthase [uncultured Schaedlerella sp.]
MNELKYCSNEEIYEKEMDLSAEEIEGYETCSARMQMCLTDCPWPFTGSLVSPSR